MHFSKSVITLTASLVSLGLAADPLIFTSWPHEPLEPGKPVTLTWTGADPGLPVTIFLRQGPSGDLQDVKPITTSSKGDTFTWTPDNDIKPGNTYAFQITQKDQTNYTALLKSAGKPAADVPAAKDAKPETGTAATATTGTTTGTTTSVGAATGTNIGTTTGTSPGTATVPTTDTTTGITTDTTETTSAPHTQIIDGTTETTQATQTTMTSTASKPLISSATNPSGSPSSSAAARSTDSSKATDTEVFNGKEASSTGSMRTGAASIPQFSLHLVMGITGLLAYLV